MKKHITKMKKTVVESKNLNQVNPKVAGIDIGANSIFVCAGLANGKQEIREFSTFTGELKAMVKWLKSYGIKSVAMESTGVYWIPIYDLLSETGSEVLLVNAHYLKIVPGRKTDIKDCQWIYQLHSYGLLRGSFRPDNEGVILRNYVRQRSRLVRDAATQSRLMHKALTQMNLQLNQVLSDITGTTGLNIIRAIVAGEHDAMKLAKLRDYRCKKEEADVAKALEGNFRSELIFSLKQSLEAYDFFNAQITFCEHEIEKLFASLKPLEQTNVLQISSENLEPLPKKKATKRSSYCFDASANLKTITGIDLTEIPGIDANTAMQIIAEIGTDMSFWPTVKHFTSWLKLCPNNKISGGKVLSSRSLPTANKAAQALRMAAYTLHRSKSAIGAFLRRLKNRLGSPKAITATAHKLAKIIYYMFKNHTSYKETGQEHYENLYKERIITNLKKRAKELGYNMIEIVTV